MSGALRHPPAMHHDRLASPLVEGGVAAQPHELVLAVKIGAHECMAVDPPILVSLLRIGDVAGPPNVASALAASRELKAF